MDKDKDGNLSIPEVKDSWFADFHSMNDTNKNGLVESSEWNSRISFMRRGKNAVLAIKPGGKGDITETHVLWTREKGAPYVPNPLVVGDRVFTVKDGGLASCYRTATGEVIFESVRLGHTGEYMSSPIRIGDLVYVGNTKGEFLAIKLGEKPTVENVTKFEGPIIATPAATGGRLYVRAGSTLYALGARPN
jgi:outer membrane protein assembly factor BamB